MNFFLLDENNFVKIPIKWFFNFLLFCVESKIMLKKKPKPFCDAFSVKRNYWMNGRKNEHMKNNRFYRFSCFYTSKLFHIIAMALRYLCACAAYVLLILAHLKPQLLSMYEINLLFALALKSQKLFFFCA